MKNERKRKFNEKVKKRSSYSLNIRLKVMATLTTNELLALCFLMKENRDAAVHRQ